MSIKRLNASCVWCLLAVVTASAWGQEFQSFDFPGAVETEANAVTPSGDVSGAYFNADGSQHGFVLHKGQFTSIDVPGAMWTSVTWMNVSGRVVGAYNTGGAVHG